jgi:prepilin-type processing-associated H-X9-DG protein
LASPADADAFASLCRATSSVVAADVKLWIRGRPWPVGGEFETTYNHLLTPNENNCGNGPIGWLGASTAASSHGSGISLLYADGHVAFIHNSVNLELWRAMATRNGSDRGVD